MAFTITSPRRHLDDPAIESVDSRPYEHFFWTSSLDLPEIQAQPDYLAVVMGM
jgi:hypothetical protein